MTLVLMIDVKNEYQIDIIEYEHYRKADAVMVAVPHDEFISTGWNGIQNC